MATANFSLVFNEQTKKIQFTDTGDYTGLTLADLTGNLKCTSPSGVVFANNTDNTIISGTAQAGGTGTITLQNNSSAIDDYYNGKFIYIHTGTGSTQVRKIVDYNGTSNVATIISLWSTVVDNTSEYYISESDIYLGGVIAPIDDTATSGTADTITFPNTFSATNDFYNSMYIKITAGTGVGQVRQISDYVASTFTATVSEDWMTNPDSTSEFSISYSPFFTDATNLSQIEISIPLLSDGTMEEGTYSFEYMVYDDSTGIYYTKAKTFALEFEKPVVSISTVSDCISLSPTFTSTDGTSYTNGIVEPTIERKHRLYQPIYEGSPLPTILSPDAVLLLTSYYTGTNTTSIISNLTYIYSDDFYIYSSVNGQEETVVTCDVNLCDIYCCHKTLYDKWIAALGVNGSQANIYFVQLQKVSILTDLFKEALSCGYNSDAETYYQEILTAAGCTAGCGCSDDSEPQLVLGGGGLANTINVLSGNGITVNSTTSGGITNYTVNLSNSILNKINNSYSTTVSGTVNIAVVESGTDPKNFEITGATITAGSGVTVTTTTNGDGIITDYEIASNGAIILENDFTAEATTVTPGYNDKKSYSIAAGTLSVDGDALQIRQYFTRVSDQFVITPLDSLEFTLNATAVQNQLNFLRGVMGIMIEATIVRISDVSIKYTCRWTRYDKAKMEVDSAFFESPSPITVNDLDSLSNTLATLTRSNVIGNVVYQSQEIYLFKKIV
jgi:hypothetical protein